MGVWPSQPSTLLPPPSPASPFSCRPYLTFAPGHNRAMILARRARITSDDFKISSLNGDLGIEDKSLTSTVCVIYG